MNVPNGINDASGSSNKELAPVVEQLNERLILSIESSANPQYRSLVTYSRMKSRINDTGNVVIEQVMVPDILDEQEPTAIAPNWPYDAPLFPIALGPTAIELARQQGHCVGGVALPPVAPVPAWWQETQKDWTTKQLVKMRSRSTVRLLKQLSEPLGFVLIRRAACVRVEWLISQVLLAYPDQHVTIATATNRQAKTLARHLERLTDMSVNWLGSRRRLDPDARVAIGVPTRFPRDGALAASILVLVEPERMLGRRETYSLDNCSPRRVIGIMHDRAALSGHERQLITRRFGQVSLGIPAEGKFERRVHLRFLTFKHRSKLPAEAALLDVKRTEIWRGRRRNDLIARLAKKLAVSRRIGVIVENLEHAVELTRFMPEARIAVKKGNRGQRLTRSARVVLADKARLLRRLGTNADPINGKRNCPIWIISYADVGAVDFGPLDILIRADGGFGCSDRLRALLFTANDKQLDVSVVDINDRSHPHLIRATRSRRRSYFESLHTPGALMQQCNIATWVKKRVGGKS